MTNTPPELPDEDSIEEPAEYNPNEPTGPHQDSKLAKELGEDES